jgi:hypothetical protein
MSVTLTLLLFFAMTQAFGAMLADKRDRGWMAGAILAGWACFFPLLYFVNAWYPYAGGGDDEGYFLAAAIPFESWTDVFDFPKFSAVVEQPGYPWLLALIYQFAGHDLLCFKLLNLAIFIALAVVWYRIGSALHSPQFGRSMVIAILLVTPLWFFWMMLLKDIVITFLQSVFLWGVVEISSKRGRSGWILALIATLALIPFRTYLVLANLATVAGATMLLLMRRKEFNRALFVPLLASVLVAIVLALASSSQFLAELGINETRVISMDTTQSVLASSSSASRMNRKQFPLLYLLSETTGLNPESYASFSGNKISGLLALPWILVGVPFVCLGFVGLLRPPPGGMSARSLFARIQASRAVTTPWGVVIVFVFVYIGIAWSVGDTTRWRMPDMPALASIGMAGWAARPPRKRVAVMLAWGIVSFCAFMIYYIRR